jgi:hypothetical protein
MCSGYVTWCGVVLTSEVMEMPLDRAYLLVMTSHTASITPATPTALQRTASLAGIILVAFTAYSLWVVAGHGYFGFISLALDHDWAMQLLLDLVLACSFGLAWVTQDARKRGITTLWPYYVMTVFVGSIGLLAYVVRRGFARA